MTDRRLELADIQGNVLAGFNTDIQILIGLHVPRDNIFANASAWIATLADSITTVADIASERRTMKEDARDQKTWLSIAVSKRFLSKTQPDVFIRDNAFRGGMLKRARSLGDKTNRDRWRVGSDLAPLDILFVIAGNNDSLLRSQAGELIAAATNVGLKKSYEETAHKIGGREHFGFQDGISQPRVVGYHPDGEIGAGHFIFGYPQAPGGRSHSPPIDPRRITDNGSLLVFRRLAQDVRVFREFCQAEATRIAEQWPEFNASRLAALMVGRWPSGVPTRRYQKTDPGGLSRDNDFDFLDDADGTHCPFGAHIRKVNPRKGQRDVVDVPRMLRRGIPFGPPYDEQPDTERGLIFLAYQTSISSQFEFLTKRWMNSNLNPGPGHDLLVGRSDGERSFTMKGPVEPVVVSDRGQQWINPTGGAYLFAPSRSGLAKFGTPSSQFGWWKAKQFWAITSDKVHELLFDQ